MRQLILDLRLDDSQSFANYYVGAHNQAACQLVRKLADEPAILVLSGLINTGKTHLLQAICQDFVQHHKQVLYLPLKQFRRLEPDNILPDNIPDLIVLDDASQVFGNDAWEKALFELYNQTFDQNSSLLICLENPTSTPPLLPDLKSRLAGIPSIEIEKPTSETNIKILQFCARQQGMQINDKVANYIHNNYSRNLGDIIKLLDKITHYTMEYQRKITIPFIKKISRVKLS